MMFVVDQNMMAAISSTENEVYKGSVESEASLTDFSGYMGKRKSRLHFENTIFNQITCLMQHSFILVYLISIATYSIISLIVHFHLFYVHYIAHL
jgi:hypothetical protein